MRTNIVIDDQLMRDAMQASGARTKREAVEIGLRTLVKLDQQQRIKALRGQLFWEGDLASLRQDRPLAAGEQA
jgi:Arc/MetJ family transcription regulator